MIKPDFSRGVLAVGCLIGCMPALAQVPAANAPAGNRKELSMFAGALVSDNIGKAVDADAESQTQLELGLNANMRVERERLAASLAADLRYQTGRDDAVGNELAGGLTATADYHLLSDRLSWSVQDNFAQALVNAIDVASPQNTQNVNVITTGPRVVMPLGTRTSVALEGGATNVWYQESDFGNNRLIGGVSLLRQLGAGSQLSLNGQAESVKYSDLPQSADYDIKSAYLGWTARGVKTTLHLDAGYTQLSQDTGNTSGARFLLDITRRLNARTELKLDAGRSFGNSADNLRGDQSIRGVSANSRPDAVSADPMRADVVSAAWRFGSSRSSAALRADWRRENHSRQTEYNHTETRGDAEVGRVLGPRLSIELRGGYSVSKYNLSDVRFSEWEVGAGATWRANAALSIGLRLSHSMGTGDTSKGLGTRDYTENRGELRLAYTPRL
jgi:hypothetical protein